MYKKIILIVLVVLTAFGLLYYANVNLIRSENKKVQQDLQSKINNLEQELQTKSSQIQKNAQDQINQGLEANTQNVLLLTDVKIISNEAYKDGVSKGAIYGSFDVKAKVKNTGASDVYNVKVASLFVKSNSRYGKDIGVDAKSQGIDKLVPGEEKEVTFTGYKVVHPDTYQEIEVSILHSSIGEKAEGQTVKRVRILAAFPPGSND